MRLGLDWFQQLFGCEEPRETHKIDESFEVYPSNDQYGNFILHSKRNNREFPIGKFSTPTIKALRDRLNELLERIASQRCDDMNNHESKGDWKVIEVDYKVIQSVFSLHYEYPKATFQAASQFNCLEFPNPRAFPELGITFYCTDHTQGPACALACAAGTMYRNYFTPVPIPDSAINDLPSSIKRSISTEGTIRGQSKQFQLNTLDLLEGSLDNAQNEYWFIENGYTFSKSENNLLKLNQRLSSDYNSDELREELIEKVKVGFHEEVGVTFNSQGKVIPPHLPDVIVNQVYCSALSCAYSGISNVHWEPLARIVLQAMYEGAVLAGMIKWLESLVYCTIKTSKVEEPQETFENQLFLTFVGGGVFGNEMSWIYEAIGRAIAKVESIILAHPQRDRIVGYLSQHQSYRVNGCLFRKMNEEVVEEITRFYESFSK